jgi:hypothetical protein
MAKRELSAQRYKDLEQKYDQLAEAEKRHHSAYRSGASKPYANEIFTELTPVSHSHYLGQSLGLQKSPFKSSMDSMSLSRSPNSRLSYKSRPKQAYDGFMKNHDLPQTIMRSPPKVSSRSPKREILPKKASPLKQPSPKRSSPLRYKPMPQHAYFQNENVSGQNRRHLEATPQSPHDSASFGMTPQREVMKYRAENDKVVGYYKKVMSDLRHTIQNERQQVQRYLH